MSGVYTKIAALRRFPIPTAYRRMWRLEAEVRAHRSTTPGRLPPAATDLALNFRLISPKSIAAWRKPAYWKRHLRFIPVGRTGAGDDYVWFPAWRTHAGTPILLASRDENRCEAVAPNLAALLYRETLDKLAFYSLDELAEDFDVGSRNVRSALRAVVDAMRPFVRQRWHDDLVGILQREPQQWMTNLARPQSMLTLLTEDELNIRIKRELKFEQLHRVFRHMVLADWDSGQPLPTRDDLAR